MGIIAFCLFVCLLGEKLSRGTHSIIFHSYMETSIAFLNGYFPFSS